VKSFMVSSGLFSAVSAYLSVLCVNERLNAEHAEIRREPQRRPQS